MGGGGRAQCHLMGWGKEVQHSSPWAGGPLLLAMGPEVLRRGFWAQPLKSPFAPDLNTICLASNKELRTPFPLHSSFNSIERCRRQATSTGQVLENLKMGEPRPSRPLPQLSGAICTTDHVVSANLTAPRTPRAQVPGPSPLCGVLGSPPALRLPAARAFLLLQLPLTLLASSAARRLPPRFFPPRWLL